MTGVLSLPAFNPAAGTTIITNVNSFNQQAYRVYNSDNGTQLIEYPVGNTDMPLTNFFYVNGTHVVNLGSGISVTNVPTTTMISTTIWPFNTVVQTTAGTYLPFAVGNHVLPSDAGMSLHEREVRMQLAELKDELRPVRKSIRNSIKRSLKLMSGMGFEEDVRIFLNGDKIEVSHPDSLLKFSMEKYQNRLLERTINPGYSTPYKLQVLTKSDIHIANLCVYLEDTPILDQVFGVAMFIKSGDEETILSKANWSNLCKDEEVREILALEYPYLENKLQLRRPNTNYSRPNLGLAGVPTSTSTLQSVNVM